MISRGIGNILSTPISTALSNLSVMDSVANSPVSAPSEHPRSGFDVADGKGDEVGMREAAEASWEVWDGTGREWELGKVWAEKREIFYEQSKWKPLDNFT